MMDEGCYTIPIVVNEQINPMFVRANSFIISQNFDRFIPDDNNYNEKKLEELWEIVFGAQLIKKNLNVWTDIVFKNNSNKTLFLLKYSI